MLRAGQNLTSLPAGLVEGGEIDRGMKCGGLRTAKTLVVHTIKVLNVMAKPAPSGSTNDDRTYSFEHPRGATSAHQKGSGAVDRRSQGGTDHAQLLWLVSTTSRKSFPPYGRAPPGSRRTVDGAWKDTPSRSTRILDHHPRPSSLFSEKVLYASLTLFSGGFLFAPRPLKYAHAK